jgi:hypothetical protein
MSEPHIVSGPQFESAILQVGTFFWMYIHFNGELTKFRVSKKNAEKLLAKGFPEVKLEEKGEV